MSNLRGWNETRNFSSLISGKRVPVQVQVQVPVQVQVQVQVLNTEALRLDLEWLCCC